MKTNILVSLVMACLPWLAMAQNDDLYFVPGKKNVKKDEKVQAEKQAPSNTTVYAAPGSAVVVKDVTGRTRDIDEYNRRYTSRDNSFSIKNDTLYVQEKSYGERGEWVNGFEGSQSDYEYAMRIVRFRSPRYAIPVSSPLYWDVVYGAYPSWNWNVYDDGMYAYVFPTYSNPVWWNWRWNWGMTGPHWSFGYSWGPSWYYSHYYHHHHCYYPSYGWGGRWHRSGHTDFRPGRYSNYVSSRRQMVARPSSGYSFRREMRPNDSSRRTSATRRVVRPGTANRGEYTSVRPSTGALHGGAGRPAGVTRPSRGNNSYVRPSSTVDRTGSNYNRPSSTRRSAEYMRSNPNRTRSTNSFNSSRSSSSRSSFSSGSQGGYSRGSVGGGSSRRSSGSRR